MIILPVIQWFMITHTYVLRIFLVLFAFALLMMLIWGRKT